MSFRFPRPVAVVIRSLIPVACPDGGSGLDDDLYAAAELAIGAAPSHIRAALCAGVIAYDLGAIAYPAVLPFPAHRLPREQAERYFRFWASSPLGLQRELAKALKGFIAMAYYEHPVIRERLGYTPDEWIAKVGKRRLATYSADIEAAEKALTAPDPLPTGFFSGSAEEDEVSRAS
ncbi:MAG: hypothetical protein KJO07_03860 [Deltaproteobacteria bacterium]|nr:hypothetical protein [Deltaproteobacteria bacterium]